MRRSVLVTIVLAVALAALAGTGSSAALAGDTGAVGTWTPSGANVAGHKPAPRDLSYLKDYPAARSRVFKAYAASYDLRSLGRLTPVRDQGPTGTCWSFASLGSLESGLLTTTSTAWDFSEDNLVWFAGFSLGTNRYDDGGNAFMALAYLARWGGPVSETDDPFYDGSHPSGLAAQRHLNEAVFVAPRTSATGNDSIKDAVVSYGGVDVDMYWTDSAWQEATDAYYSKGSNYPNHDVVVVGWDDHYAAENFTTSPPGDGAFIVRNSWGPIWGEAGYFYISYYDTTFAYGGYNIAFADAGPADDYNRVYQYDPLGYWPEDGPYVSGLDSWFANVFTAQADDSLASAGFYTPLPGCAYEILSGPSLAGLQPRTSGTMPEPGYHVVPLDSPVTLTRGQQFVVAVKLTMPSSYHYPIPVERPYKGYSSATADPGQSFISTDGASWQDLTTVNGFKEANVCLKAFTKGLPTGTFSVNSKAAWTRSVNVTLTPAVTGAAEMRFRDAGGAWTDWESFATSRNWALPAGDGAKTVEAEFRNGSGATAMSDSISLDTKRPTTRAPYKARVHRYRYVRLYYKVTDATPSASKATVTIKIKTLGGTTRKTLKLGKRYVNKLQSYRFRCSLLKRTYRFWVYATDAAGNAQRIVGRNYLYVR